MNQDYLNIEDIFKQDNLNQLNQLESIEHQIAERKKLKYRNAIELDHQIKKVEEILNELDCFGYNPHPSVTQLRSSLQTDMIRLELKKGEEAGHASRDVARLETEKRKILSEVMENESLGLAFGGLP